MSNYNPKPPKKLSQTRRVHIGIRVPEEMKEAIAEWSEAQPSKPDLSEACRRLLDIGLQNEWKRLARIKQKAPAE